MTNPNKTRGKARSKTQSKAEWRCWAKKTRAKLDIPTLSRAVVTQLEGWALYNQAEHILTYLAFGKELELSRLSSKHFYATRTRADSTLTAHPLTKGLERHPYGFLQPAADAPEVEVGRLELILVPGLAFDMSGTRLGYGKGFYDRLLVQVQGIPLVGVVASQLIVQVLPAEPHDVRMTHLVSEKGAFEVER